MPTEQAKMNELFVAAKPALLAMDADILVRPRVPRERATQLTAILLREIEPLVPRFAEELAPARVKERKADVAAVGPNAQIYYAADLAVEVPWTSEQKARRAELVKNVHTHDDYLSGWAIPLFKHDEELSARVADIVRGKGTRDDAEDTVRWAALFREQWAHAKGKTPVTLEYLAGAEAEATELLQMLDLDNNESLGSPRDLRRRAFTRWVTSYDELYSLGRYLLRDDPESAARIPGIAAERGEPEATPPANPPATPATPATPADGATNPK